MKNKPENNNQPEILASLRQRAEARLPLSSQSDSTPDNLQDVQRLLAELHIHQIELELQNDELRRTVFQDPQSFFRHFAELSDDQATALAKQIWESINGRNLRENIAPTKARASLVIEKGADHRVTDVFLRKL